MADGRFDGLFTSLNAGYEAALAREEDEAAADLAFSLLQDRDLNDALLRGGRRASVHLGPGHLEAITGVGRDYLATGTPTRLVPMRAATVVLGDQGSPPPASRDSLIGVLRRWARQGAWVELGGAGGAGSELSGRLLRAGRDHLHVKTRAGEVLVAIDALSWIRCARGGSEGA